MKLKLGTAAAILDMGTPTLSNDGMSYQDISEALGYGKTFIENDLHRHRYNSDMLARIADVCGYKLVLMPDDGNRDLITIEPETTSELYGD